jgi:hypothetical protein
MKASGEIMVGTTITTVIPVTAGAAMTTVMTTATGTIIDRNSFI